MDKKGRVDREKVIKAALDNPDLPLAFVKESLTSMAEPRDSSSPFIPRSRVNADQSYAGKTRILRLLEFLKSLPNRRSLRSRRADLYD